MVFKVHAKVKYTCKEDVEEHCVCVCLCMLLSVCLSVNCIWYILQVMYIHVQVYHYCWYLNYFSHIARQIFSYCFIQVVMGSTIMEEKDVPDALGKLLRHYSMFTLS